jgi:hypothetical protein
MNPINRTSVNTTRLADIKSELNKKRGFFGCILGKPKTQGQQVKNALKALVKAGKVRTVYANGILASTTSSFEQTLLRVNRFSPARPKSDGSLGDASAAMDAFDKKIASAQKQYAAYRKKEEAFHKEFATFCDDLKLLPEERIAILDDLLSQQSEKQGMLATDFRKGNTKELTQRLAMHSIKYNALIETVAKALYTTGTSIDTAAHAILHELMGAKPLSPDDQAVVWKRIQQDLREAVRQTLEQLNDLPDTESTDEEVIQSLIQEQTVELRKRIESLQEQQKTPKQRASSLTQQITTLNSALARIDRVLSGEEERLVPLAASSTDPLIAQKIKLLEKRNQFERIRTEVEAELNGLEAALRSTQSELELIATRVRGTHLNTLSLHRRALITDAFRSEDVSPVTTATHSAPGSLGNSFSSQYSSTGPVTPPKSPVSDWQEPGAFPRTESDMLNSSF